ncbi:MAG: type I-B CRISPR-associated protein Cas7/Csh2 [Candidatus Neomarinimicrobiota bacterium]|jgi:CRISPR-associated protein Csh2|nr:type I-B CRISPR-associated protein Cas7/Csh2 [Candidatus Neomarinimicrobiota bacterium]
MSKINNRSEILFLYDIQNANPNGDPNDENKPRMDEETGRNIVTDVRLKRTIRDYLHEVRGNEIFVREIEKEDGTIQDAKTRAKDFGDNKTEITNSVLSSCIDVRLFGATIPLEKKKKKAKKGEQEDQEDGESAGGTEGEGKGNSITFTGPVQFKMGRSLHSVKMIHIKGTGAFASGEKSTKKTFREEDILPYSLIAFYGIINENAGKHTLLNQDDVKLLKEAIWNGTKGLISRSKFGQMPRLLLIVNYKQPDFFIGDLDNLIELKSIDNIRPEQLRKPEDYRIDMSQLVGQIKKHKDKIENIEYAADDRMSFVCDGKEIELEKLDMFKKISL